MQIQTRQPVWNPVLVMQASLPKKNSKYTSHMLTLTQKTVLAYLWGRVTVQNWRLVWRCMPRSPARVHALSFVVMWTSVRYAPTYSGRPTRITKTGFWTVCLVRICALYHCYFARVFSHVPTIYRAQYLEAKILQIQSWAKTTNDIALLLMNLQVLSA